MTERKLDDIHFLDGPGVPRARETGVVNHASVTDIDTVVGVSVPRGDQMRADGGFLGESRRPASLCGNSLRGVHYDRPERAECCSAWRLVFMGLMFHGLTRLAMRRQLHSPKRNLRGKRSCRGAPMKSWTSRP